MFRWIFVLLDFRTLPLGGAARAGHFKEPSKGAPCMLKGTVYAKGAPCIVPGHFKGPFKGWFPSKQSINLGHATVIKAEMDTFMHFRTFPYIYLRMFRLLSNTLRWTQHDGHCVTMQTGHQVWKSVRMLSDALRWTHSVYYQV